MTVDLHQHLWPDAFLHALRARTRTPRMDGWTLVLEEGAYAIDPAAHDVERAGAPRGGRRLRRRVRRPVGGARDRPLPRRGVELPRVARRRARAAAAVPGVGRRPTDPAALAEALDRGAIGLELAADALAAPGGLDELAPLLDVLDAARRPLFVHPGPPGPATAGRARVVDAGRPVRRATARRLVGVGRRRARALPATCRSASPRSPASGRCTVSATAPAAAAARRSTRSRSSRPPPTGRRPSTRRSACWGSTSCASAPTARTPSPAMPALDAAALHAIGTRNAERLLAHAHGGPADGIDATDRLDASSRAAPRAARAGALDPALRPGVRAAHATRRCTATTSVDVWAIFWLPENDTGWHDHDTSSGAVHVVSGALEEHELIARRPGPPPHPPRRHDVLVQPVAHPPDDLRGPAGDLDPRLLAAAVAAGPVLGRRRGAAVPAVGLLRGRAAPRRDVAA